MPHHVIQNDNEIPPPQYRARQEVQNVRFVDLENLSLAEKYIQVTEQGKTIDS